MVNQTKTSPVLKELTNLSFDLRYRIDFQIKSAFTKTIFGHEALKKKLTEAGN